MQKLANFFIKNAHVIKKFGKQFFSTFTEISFDFLDIV